MRSVFQLTRSALTLNRGRWYDLRVERRSWDKETVAFWVAPLGAIVPLVVFFGLSWSPLYLGKLMDDSTHVFLRPGVGPWLAAMAVIFDGTVLAYAMAAPLYLLLRTCGKVTALQVVVFFAATGVAASLLVHGVQDFRQPELRAFAESWLSPVFGCLSGVAAGGAFVALARRQFPAAARALAWSLPAAVLAVCGTLLMWSAHAGGSR